MNVFKATISKEHAVIMGAALCCKLMGTNGSQIFMMMCTVQPALADVDALIDRVAKESGVPIPAIIRLAAHLVWLQAHHAPDYDAMVFEVKD